MVGARQPPILVGIAAATLDTIQEFVHGLAMNLGHATEHHALSLGQFQQLGVLELDGVAELIVFNVQEETVA